MALLRFRFQVRTIPERVMEWVLVFVPLDLFEAGVRQFGFDAKRYGLYASAAGMLLILAAIGAFALRRRWSARMLLGMALGLWLFTMVVIMPLTSAGLFAMGLPSGTGEAVWGHLAVALTYASTLAGILTLIAALSRRANVASRPPHGGRRRDASERTPSTVVPAPSRRSVASCSGAPWPPTQARCWSTGGGRDRP